MQPTNSKHSESDDSYGCDLILRAGTILTQDPQAPIIDDGAVAVKDGRIRDIGPSGRIFRHYTALEVRYFGPDSVMIPGLINAHTHAPMTLLRGMADDLPLMDWLNKHIFPRERKLSGELVELGTLLACAEMARYGTTAFCDMYLLEDAVFRAVDRAGMRMLAGEVLFAFPGPAYSGWEEGVKLAAEQIARWQNHDRIRAAVMPHSVYTTGPDLLEACAQLARETKSRLHIHLAETEAETRNCIAQHGMRPVAWCRNVGILGPDTLIAHGVDLLAQEIEILAGTGTAIAHCARSNMKLGSGIAPVPQMLDRGMTVGLGTDGAASSNNLNLFEEMHVAALLHKVDRRDPTVLPAQKALDMATTGSAACLGLHDAGQLRPGALADCAILDFSEPNLQPRNDEVSSLVYAATGAETVLTVVGGQILYDQGKFPRLDMALLRREAAEAARTLRSIHA